MNKQKLNIYRNENSILNDSFDQAVMNLHVEKEQHGYKTFVVCGCEAGDGATTTAINIAAAFALAGVRTVLIDGDMRKKKVYKHLNEDTDDGLSNYLRGFCALEDVIYETTTSNLFYIPCGELITNPLRTLCSTKMTTLKKELEEKFDFIVYDMPAVASGMDAKVIAAKSDAVILVSSLNKTSKKSLVSAANTLSDSNINLIGTIINKASMDEYKRYRKDYDYFDSEKYVKQPKKAKRL